MIDRTLLTEALASTVWASTMWHSGAQDEWASQQHRIREAARLLLDFPTDEQVQAFADADEWVLYDRDRFGNITGDWHYVTLDEVRAGLVAVRDTMIGDSDD